MRRESKKLSRRQFLHMAAASGAALTILPHGMGRAAQASRKRIVIHTERPITSLGYHNRRDTEHVSMADAGLVFQNPVTLERVPFLAEELPSVKKGTWKIDMQKKSMITVYKLRAGLKWHDGKPYTSKDFEFGWQIAKHPEFPMPDRLVPEMISKIETPDDRTIVIHWNDLYNEAYAVQYTHVRAFPRHLLQDAFSAGDMKAFANLPNWNKTFVGAGPYRVVDWEGGNRLELEAFNDFALGRPKIDRVTLKFVDDSNTNLAAVLAGEVDFCMRSTISSDGAEILRQQWEKQGKGKVHVSPASWTWLSLSRDNPWFGDVRVRRALLHAVDREAMIKSVFKGENLISHFPLSRIRKSHKKALAAATVYKYDPERAKKLLAEVGWKPGPEGVLVNDKGEKFEFEFRVQAGRREHEQAQAIIGDYWKKIGVRIVVKNLPNRLLNSAENRTRWPGAYIGSHNVTVEEWAERFHGKNIPTAENKYALENVSGWNDPKKDAILDELSEIITPERSEKLQIDFAKMFSEALPLHPLYYNPEVLVAKKGLTGVTPRQESGGQNSSTWNIFKWDKV